VLIVRLVLLVGHRIKTQAPKRWYISYCTELIFCTIILHQAAMFFRYFKKVVTRTCKNHYGNLPKRLYNAICQTCTAVLSNITPDLMGGGTCLSEHVSMRRPIKNNDKISVTFKTITQILFDEQQDAYKSTRTAPRKITQIVLHP
jgi:hypothetical protein